MPTNLKRIAIEACLLVVFGALCGLIVNHQLVMDAFSGRLVPSQCAVEQPSAPAAALPIPVLLDEVQQMLDCGGMAVDARSAELYAQGHIDGAVSLPLEEVDRALPEFLDQVARDQPLIVYCSGFGCPDSYDLAVRLIEEGYLDVRVFEGGFPEWSAAGLPVTGESR